jgi:uncharacterized membrane protein
LSAVRQQARIVANNCEVPPFAYIALYASSSVNPVMSMWCTVIYTVLRVVYVVLAACGAQPFRSMVWFFSNITVIVCLIGAIAKGAEMGETIVPGVGVTFGVITGIGCVLAIAVPCASKGANPDNDELEQMDMTELGLKSPSA